MVAKGVLGRFERADTVEQPAEQPAEQPFMDIFRTRSHRADARLYAGRLKGKPCNLCIGSFGSTKTAAHARDMAMMKFFPQEVRGRITNTRTRGRLLTRLSPQKQAWTLNFSAENYSAYESELCLPDDEFLAFLRASTEFALVSADAVFLAPTSRVHLSLDSLTVVAERFECAYGRKATRRGKSESEESEEDAEEVDIVTRAEDMKSEDAETGLTEDEKEVLPEQAKPAFGEMDPVAPTCSSEQPRAASACEAREDSIRTALDLLDPPPPPVLKELLLHLDDVYTMKDVRALSLKELEEVFDLDETKKHLVVKLKALLVKLKKME